MPVLGGNAINTPFALDGLVVDGQLKNLVSGVVTTTDSNYGAPVIRGAEVGEVEVPSATFTADKFVGVLVHELNRAHTESSGMFAPVGYDASILTNGVIWVRVAGDVAVGAKAFAGVGVDVRGQFTGQAGTGATLAVEIPNAKFVSAAKAGELAKLSIVIGA